MNINNWLKNLHEAWKNHDINEVLDMFTEDVEYWETPFKCLTTKQEISNEWQAINAQQNITYSYDIFQSHDSCYTVQFDITYDELSTSNHFAGVYLIRLNDEGKCYFFYMSGQSEKSSN